MDERELLRLMREEPERGMRLFLEQYLRLIWSIVAGRAGGVAAEQEIEDCVSTVVYELYRDLDKIELSRGTIKAYVAVRARRAAIDLYSSSRKERARRAEEIPEWKGGPQPEEALLRKEERDELLRGINELGEQDREIILRKYFYYQPTKQIAKDLGIRPSTVDTRASRALEKLRRRLGGRI